MSKALLSSLRSSGAVTGCLIVLVFLSCFLGGCRTQQNRLHKFDQLYVQGDCKSTRSYVVNKTDYENDVLWALQSATVERTCLDHYASNDQFDRAEQLMQNHQADVSGLDAVGSTLVSEGVIPYRGEIYDGIMINTYKALNFMALGKDDLARVEFNRASERQRLAKEHFAKEIKKLKQEMNPDKQGGKVDYQKTVNDPNTEAAIRRKYANLYEFEAYPDFTNPFATYLAGLFFLVSGDPAKAVDLLKESTGMVGENRTVIQDFAAVDRWLSTGERLAPSVWVILENGLGPVKDEFRIDLPLFLFTNDVVYAGVALPMLAPRAAPTTALEVKSKDSWISTEMVADMDRVIQTEFAKDFPAILTRSLISATAKALMQHTLLKQQDNSGAQFLGFLSAAYTAATTVADLRMWTSLPKNFQVARIFMPADRQCQLRWNSGGSQTVTIPSCQYAIVYVKLVGTQREPVVQVMPYGAAR